MIGFAIAAVILLILILLEDRMDLKALEVKKEINLLADESMRKERKKNKWR